MSALCGPSCAGQRGGEHPETSEAEKRRMMDTLYRCGWGYHAIADLAGRPHMEIRELLIRNWRDPQEDGDG